MREIDDALERAGQEAFTREPPTSTQARINFLMRQLKTTRAVAAEIGVSEITVKVHRGNVTRKMGARSLAELVRMADFLGIRRPKA